MASAKKVAPSDRGQKTNPKAADEMASRRRLRVVVVDDHPIFRAGVIDALQGSGFIDVVGEGQSATDAERLAEELLPDILLLDIRMPGDGIAATWSISQRCPAVKIIMLTVFDDEAHVTRGLNAGARGYVIKGVAAHELLATIESVADGSSYVSPSLAARLLAKRGPAAETTGQQLPIMLSAREEKILRLVALGRSNREIGQTLGLSEKSIKHHMTNILQKLHARNRVEAALIAHKTFHTAGRA